MGCQKCRDLMVEALYDELDAETARDFGAHVEACEQCASVLAEMRGTVAMMDRHERRDPGRAYWDGYWDRLSARLEREDEAARGKAHTAWWRRNVPGGSSSGVSWAYRVVAAAAVLTLGIFVGRTYFPAGADMVRTNPLVAPEQMAATDSSSRVEPGDRPAAEAGEGLAAGERSTPAPAVSDPEPGGGYSVASADRRAMKYIEKSRMLLVGFVNYDGELGGEYLSAQRGRSESLIREASSLQGELTDPKQRRLRELVFELEKILIQISNLETDEDMDAVEFIRGRVNKHDMLLKIDLEQMKHGTDEAGSSGGTQKSDDQQRSI